MSLTNGIRIVAIHFPASTNVSIFTFLPMGLASDDKDRAQWSHLVEHLVIRSTRPANSAEANAETLPDHLRLDFYGHTGNWKEGLTHQRRWLEGVPYTGASLTAEKPKVMAECDFTARNFATHKFAVAAWSQGRRHGRTNVALKGDVANARLPDVQRYRDERLAVSNHTTVCVVGGLAAAEVFAEAEHQLSGLKLQGALTPGAKLSPRDLDLTWDLDARHLLLTWPIPDSRSDDYAALMVAAQCLNAQLFADPELKRLAGMTLAGCDLETPEGSFFYVSASLRPEANPEDIRLRLMAAVNKLFADKSNLASVIGRQLADSLTKFPDPLTLKTHAPAHVSLAMIEGNLGLQFGMQEHRYGGHRAGLAHQLSAISADQVKEVARKFLSATNAAVCGIHPTIELGGK